MSKKTFNLTKLDKMPFTGLFIFLLVRKLKQAEDVDDDALEIVEYYYMSKLGEIEKIIWITIIFALISFSHLPIFFATVIALFSIRIPSGGFHSRSSWGCFLWTLFGFLMANLVLPSLPVNLIAIIAIAIFSIISCFIASPIRDIDREAFIDKSKDKNLKYFATLMNLLWFIIIFFWLNHVTTAILWIIFLQNLQLLIEYTRRKLKIKRGDSDGISSISSR